jgi:Ni,Fe-hydrogenase maturation factor
VNIFVFGNPDHPQDSLAIKVAEKLSEYSKITFQFINPNADLPIPKDKHICLLDTIMGIVKVTLLTESDLDKLVLSPRTTAHDYDLGFQLKYLKKIGRLEKISIIGLPYSGGVDYDLIHLIFKKLVAQDMQGS